MVPELHMTYTGQAEAIDFGKSFACDADYLAHVKTYLNLLTGTAEQRAASSIADSKQTVSKLCSGIILRWCYKRSCNTAVTYSTAIPSP